MKEGYKKINNIKQCEKIPHVMIFNIVVLCIYNYIYKNYVYMIYIWEYYRGKKYRCKGSKTIPYAL